VYAVIGKGVTSSGMRTYKIARASGSGDTGIGTGTGTSTGLTIGQVSHITGVSAKAIRYYESAGLLPKPSRGENHYRRFGLGDVNRLVLLRHMRVLGVPLSAAKSLLRETADGRCSDVQRELLALMDERLAALDREMDELRRLRASVERYQRALASCRADVDMAFNACNDMRCIDASDEGGECTMEEDSYADSETPVEL
jgi:DNA-binding transcriptional MerR regulator